MNRTLANLAIAGSVIGGTAVGATLVGTAGAYGTEDTDTGDTTAPADVEQTDFVPIQDDLPAEPAEGDDERRDGRRRGGCNLEAVAEVIGIDEETLRAELDAGSSIADVAAANGVDTDAVVDAILDAKEERLDAKVEDGRITEEEAADRLADAEERALDRVNAVRGADTADA